MSARRATFRRPGPRRRLLAGLALLWLAYAYTISYLLLDALAH